jgi:hypothetical protein
MYCCVHRKTGPEKGHTQTPTMLLSKIDPTKNAFLVDHPNMTHINARNMTKLERSEPGENSLALLL